VVTNPDGTLSIDYKAKPKTSISHESKRENYAKTLQEEMPSIDEQREYTLKEQKQQKIGKDIEKDK